MSNNPGPSSQATQNQLSLTTTNLSQPLALTALTNAIVTAGGASISSQKSSTSDISISGLGTLTSFSGSTKGGITWQQTMWLPTGIDSVRIALLSDIADVSTYTGVKASVQCTDGNNLDNPSIGGVLQTFTQVTFGGAPNPIFVAGSTVLPVPIWSDWMPVTNAGSNPCYLIVRVWYPGTVAAGGGFARNDQQGGRQVELQALGANGVLRFLGADATNNNAAAVASTALTMPVITHIASQINIPSIVQYGDSTRQGYYVNGLVEGVERYGILRTIAGKPTAVSNRGVNGQTCAQYYARFAQDVANGETWNVIIWQVASVNDGASTAITQQDLVYAHAVIRAAKAMGAHIILDGPYPFSAATPSANQNAAYLAVRTFCLQMAAQESYIHAIVYDGLSQNAPTAQWVAALNNAGDGAHPNELAMNSVIYPAKSAAINAVLTGL